LQKQKKKLDNLKYRIPVSTNNKNLRMHIFTNSKSCLSFLRKTGKQLLLMLLICIGTSQAFAQVPVNDEPCGAISLTPAITCTYQTFTNVDALATTTPGVPSCNVGTFDGDVWFKATVPVGAGALQIDTKNIGLTDGLMAVYTGTSCTSLTEAACDDNSSTNTLMPKITITAAAGTTIWIRVWGFQAESGTFGICVKTVAAPPANDECSAATSLTVNTDFNCGVVTAGTTESATQSATTPIPTCSSTGINDDVWYKFIATGPSHRVSLTNIVGAVTAMSFAVYSGTSCADLVQVGCNTTNQLDVFGLTAGNTYWVRVFTTTATAGSFATFNVCIGTPPPPPLNDVCSGAVALTVNPNYSCGVVTAGTTQSATQSAETPIPTCGAANGYNDDVWYTFVATGPSHRVSVQNVVTAGTAMTIQAYSGTCGSFTPLNCSTNGVLYLTGLTAGTTYYVRVFTNVATPATVANFDICVGTPPPPPVNDECTTATPLNTNPTFTCTSSVNGTTAAATQSATTPTPTCGTVNAWDDDVWYSFVPTTPYHRITLTNISGDVTAMVIAVYSGTCAGGLTQVGCVSGNQLDLTGLVPGATYLVRVYTNSTTAGQFANFTICVGTPPPPPANDECINATPVPVNPDFNCAQTVAGTTVSAQQSTTTPTPTCASATAPGGWNDDVWYTFVATGTRHRISLLNLAGGTTDMAFAVYSGTCGALTQVACSDPELADLTGLTPGATYYVRVMTWTSTLTTTATFDIFIGTPPPPPTNDECTTAVSLTVNPDANCGVVTPGYTYGATQSASTPAPNCGGAGTWDDDVWYSFVATNVNQRVSLLNVQGTSTAMVIQVYTGTSCSNLSLIQCIAGNISNLYGLTVGQTYYVRVFTNTTTANVGASFNICVGTIPPPGPGTICNVSSPFCSTSQPAQTSPTGQTSLGQYGCLFTTPNPTWYVLQVATSGTIIININQATPTGTPIDVDYAVWGPFTSVSDGCSQIVPTTSTGSPMVSCSYSASASETATITGAIAGQYYIMLVTNFNGAAGIVTFTPGAASTGTTNCGIVCNGTATNNGPVCPGNPVQLFGSSTVTGVTYSWVGPGGYTSAVQNPPPFAAPSTPGSYVYTLTVTSGTNTCTSTTTVVVGTPAAPTVTTPVTRCQNSTPVALTATGAPGATYLWYTTATGGTGSSTAPLPPTTTIGSTTYYVSQVTGPGCESPRAAIVVNVVATPTAPTATTPVTYCQNAAAVPLTATASAGASLLWYTVATGGTGSTTAPTPSTATAGNTNYYVSQTSNGCEGPRTTITVTVNPTPAAPVATSPVNYCQNATAVPLTATGTGLLWYTVATGGTGSSTAPTPSTATVGTTTYYVTQTTGTCESPRTPIVVNVGALPAAPTVSTPVTLCQNTTASPLTATGAAGATFQWYTVATGGTALPGAPTPSTTTVGSTTYYVAQTTNGCQGPRAAIVVNVVSVLPAPTVTTPVVYCQNATAVPLTATPNAGATLIWYTVPTGGTGSATAPTPSTATPGNTSYYVSQSNTGSCEGPRATIVVTVNALPAAPTAPSPVNYCQNATAVPLTATGTGLLWYTVATGGTGSATAPTPSTAVGGTTTYYVSQTATSCEGPRTPVVVNVTATPALPTVTTPVTYCRGATPVQLTATGTSLLWYSGPTGGTGSSTAPTPSTATAGTTVYYVSQSTGTCEGPRAAISVVVNPTPAAPVVVSPLTYCQNATAPALTATGTGLLWYTAATGGTGSSTAPVPSTTASGSTTYYVSQTTGTCEGPRAAIIVNVAPKLFVNAGNDVTIGFGQTTQLNGTASPSPATYLWTSNITPLSLSSNVILNPVATPLETTTYKLTVTDPTGLCPSVSDDVLVTVVINCIDVQNAFSPNGDGTNDLWRVYSQFGCLSNVKVTMFNRYGSKIFENTNYRNDWNGTYKGKPVPDGTYYAVIEFTMVNGTKRYVRTDVTVLR
jgi:gliding motility-associated-like protein